MPFAPKEPNKKIWRMAKFCTTAMPICCRGWNRSHSQHKRKQKSLPLVFPCCHSWTQMPHWSTQSPPTRRPAVFGSSASWIQIKRLGWTTAISWQTSKYPTKQTTISISNSFRRYQHHPDKQIPRDLAINSDAEQRWKSSAHPANKPNSTPKPHPISKQIKSGELYKGPVVLLLSQAAKKELSHPAQLPVRMLSRALCLFLFYL